MSGDYVTPYWVKFSDRKPGCIEAATKDDAMLLAEEFGKPISAEILPYPASPQLGPTYGCPAFCWKPEECKGRTSCPRRFACSD